MSRTPLADLSIAYRPLKRAQYEAFEFTLEDRTVIVRNGSHANPADHEYEVDIEDGIPVACSCPADATYENACKHRLAVAIREPLVKAVAEQPTAATDGGTNPEPSESEAISERRDSECDCDGLPDDFPCWPCYRESDCALADD